MEHFVRRLLEQSGLTATELARRSGLSRSTQFRIDTDAIDPRVGTLRDLAIAAGVDIRVDLEPLSDPDAARAARTMLDGRYSVEPTKTVSQWIARLRRFAGEDPVDIVRAAGECSSLLKRRGAAYLSGHVDEAKLVGAATFTPEPWILSGRGAMERLAHASSLSAPYVVYSGDAHRLIRILDNMTQVKPGKATLIIAQYTEDLDIDAWEDGRARLVAPVQTLIDGFGLGGPLAEAAETIARSW